MSYHACEHRCGRLTSANPRLGKPDPEEEDVRDFNDKARPPPDHQKELVNLVASISHRHGQWQVFSDFAEMAAISISNAVDLADPQGGEPQTALEEVQSHRIS